MDIATFPLDVICGICPHNGETNYFMVENITTNFIILFISLIKSRLDITNSLSTKRDRSSISQEPGKADIRDTHWHRKTQSPGRSGS
jgi:hypothetical protein